jgi:osmotically inducible protein OsmC
MSRLEKEKTMTQPVRGPGAAQLEKVLFTAKTHTNGGRDNGISRSSDGRLDIQLSVPGTTGTGTNPEQLFAAGWSACFEGAMGLAARKMKITLPPELAIDAEVDLNLMNGAFFLRARLNVILPGMERDVAQAVVEAAHQTCPYSKATHDNIDVTITLVVDGDTIPIGVYLANRRD